MNPDIKTRWVEALRSGQYKQGTGYLRVRSEPHDRFCCLGVLCALAETDEIIALEGNGEDRCYSYGNRFAGLPNPVIEWAGLRTDHGDPVVIEESRMTLAVHNDTGRSFVEIADAIEAQL